MGESPLFYTAELKLQRNFLFIKKQLLMDKS